MSQQLFKRSEKTVFADVGGDVVALQVDRGQCYGMENVTAALWALLAEPSDLENLCNRLMEQYEVEPSVCRSEISTVIQRMVEEGLIEKVSV